MKHIFLVFIIPLSLFGRHSLSLDWRTVAQDENGLRILADVHELARTIDTSEFYDIVEAYEINGHWDDKKATTLLKTSSHVENEVRKALRLNVWQVDGFYAPDSVFEELDAFNVWTAIKIIRFQQSLLSGSATEAYTHCKELSQSGLKLMGAKGSALHFLVGFSAYSKGLEILDDLKIQCPSLDYDDYEVPLETIKVFYRDSIRHEYQSALNTVVDLAAQLERERNLSEYTLLDVQATQKLITEAYQEAIDNSYLIPSRYKFKNRDRIEFLIDRRHSPENLMNAAGLELLGIINFRPESIWTFVESRLTSDANESNNGTVKK